ncbi:helix-turn-helix transcriptional regulator [Aeromonas veronii]|uniref:helix-turn-helix transcriptional regulator n=1 Tax=Aeromonas TaxID=642 RepID=UPI003006383A
MAKESKPTLTIIRRNEVEARTGLSRSTIYAKMRPNPKYPNVYDPTFPKPVSIGAKAVGWIEEELEAWLIAQIQKRREA